MGRGSGSTGFAKLGVSAECCPSPCCGGTSTGTVVSTFLVSRGVEALEPPKKLLVDSMLTPLPLDSDLVLDAMGGEFGRNSPLAFLIVLVSCVDGAVVDKPSEMMLSVHDSLEAKSRFLL